MVNSKAAGTFPVSVSVRSVIAGIEEEFGSDAEKIFQRIWKGIDKRAKHGHELPGSAELVRKWKNRLKRSSKMRDDILSNLSENEKCLLERVEGYLSARNSPSNLSGIRIEEKLYLHHIEIKLPGLEEVQKLQHYLSSVSRSLACFIYVDGPETKQLDMLTVYIYLKLPPLLQIIRGKTLILPKSLSISGGEERHFLYFPSWEAREEASWELKEKYPSFVQYHEGYLDQLPQFCRALIERHYPFTLHIVD